MQPADIAAIARGLVQEWSTNPYAIHKRPPFRARSFDDDGRYWVVGSTTVSVLHGWHGSEQAAERYTIALNDACDHLLSKDNDDGE